MGFGIPSWSDVKNTVSNTTQNLSSAASSVRDLGASAIERTTQLASDGVDLGRRAVNAVRSIDESDLRAAAATVRDGIGTGIEAAREGIKTGVEWSGQRVHDGADFARNHVPGGDNIISNTVRGAITMGENSTRFQLGVVGGVAREAVGLVGTVGELATTGVEMQISPEARLEYGQKLVDGATGAVQVTGQYLDSVARDPSRLGSDISGAATAGKDWAGGQLDRYEQAFREGKGFETVGLDVGTVATYVVPVGGGPARGALTAAARGAGEVTVRAGAETLVRGGAETLVRGGTEAVAREVGEATIRSGAELAVRGGSEIAVRNGTEVTVAAGARAAVTDAATVAAKGDYGVAFFGQDNLRYYTAQNATLGRQGGAFFHMPAADAVLVKDAASAARYTGHAPSALQAYTSGGEIYGISFPRAGLQARVPTAADAGGWPHFLEGGHTAVRTEGDLGGFLINPTREFVIDGGRAVPEGSILFHLQDGKWLPIKTF